GSSPVAPAHRPSRLTARIGGGSSRMISRRHRLALAFGGASDRPPSKRKGSTSADVACPTPKRPFWADWDGTVMEQRGRNGWQTFGSPKGRKWLDLAPNRCHWLPPVAVWIAW